MIEKGYYEGVTDLHEINNKNTRQIDLIYLPIFEKESLDLIKQWEEKNL